MAFDIQCVLLAFHPVFKIQFAFLSHFMFTEKIKGTYRDFPYPICPHICITVPLSISFLVPLLLFINLHRCIIITKAHSLLPHPSFVCIISPFLECHPVHWNHAVCFFYMVTSISPCLFMA